MNKYLTYYNKLIEQTTNLNRQRGDDYFEEHHIIPKSFGGDNNASNLVLLTAKEHFIAHLLLAKGTNDSKMIKALHIMTYNDAHGSRYKPRSSRIYDYIRRKNAKIVSEYSKNTVTAYDNIEECYRRIPSALFQLEPTRYSAPNKGRSRSKHSILKQEETKFPFILNINGYVITNMIDFREKISKAFKTRDLVNLYFGTAFKRPTALENSKWNSITNITGLNNKQALIKLSTVLTLYLKNGVTKETLHTILKGTCKTKGADANKSSREKRTKFLYITPKGKFKSRHDFQQIYGFSNTVIESIIQNKTITNRNLRHFLKYDLDLFKNACGKTWSELGFTAVKK